MQEEDDILKFLNSLGGALGGFAIPIGPRRNAPTTSNPEKYARSVPLKSNEDLLMAHQRIKVFEREMRRLGEELSLATHKHAAAKAEFFMAAKRVYPDVEGDGPGGGVGFREWKGELYLVGWDKKEDDEEEASK